MTIHHFSKLLSVSLHYGWFGLVYGILFSLMLEEYGYAVPLWIRIIITVGTLIVSVGVAYAMEMRYHTPSQKYWTIAIVTLLCLLGLSSHPSLYPLSFLFFLGMIVYRCKDCVAYTRIKR
ncbi:MAG: hypothetical protein PHN18_03205 [Sulfurospirillaceae bacterium]|jgi:hypothetical protein|nr:hypothetical protein [Sulfurospirillaceae bacterium]MDD2825585.1 hypothetical protein [Sulfurospirillaceae bacterium]